jgi:hypothetical protein
MRTRRLGIQERDGEMIEKNTYCMKAVATMTPAPKKRANK